MRIILDVVRFNWDSFVDDVLELVIGLLKCLFEVWEMVYKENRKSFKDFDFFYFFIFLKFKSVFWYIKG